MISLFELILMIFHLCSQVSSNSYYTSLVKSKEGNCGSESPVVASHSVHLDHPYDEPQEYANQLRPSEYMNI